MSQPAQFKSVRAEERKAMRRRVLTDAEKRRILDARADGVPVSMLARRFDVSECSITEVVREAKR